MNWKFSAYRGFAINAEYQGKKSQGRHAESPLADLRSPRYIFAWCNSGQNCSRALFRDVHSRMFTPLRIVASAKRQKTLSGYIQPRFSCVLLSRDEDVCREPRVTARPDNAKSSPAVIESALTKPQWKRYKMSKLKLSRSIA